MAKKTNMVKGFWNHCAALDEEEQDRLGRLASEGDTDARDKLIKANMKLVSSIAGDYDQHTVHGCTSPEDLHMEGAVGLCQAIDKYDPEQGKFSTYAMWWIKAMILSRILNDFRLVKVGTTVWQRKIFYRLSREKDALIKSGNAPTRHALADVLDVNPEHITEMEQRMGSEEVSLAAPIANGDAPDRSGERTLLDVIAAEGDPEYYVSNRLMYTWVQDRMVEFEQRLSGNELIVWNHRIASEDPMPLREVGEMLGASKQYAQQIEKKLTARFAKYARNHRRNEMRQA